MKKLIVPKPMTFFSDDRNILILDDKMNYFFGRPNRERNINFNLPVGTFYTENNITPKPFVPYVQYVPLNLSIDPKTFKLIVEKNKNKATINTGAKTITVDKSIEKNEFKPVQTFIIRHEIAHLKHGGSRYDGSGKIIFDAEKACDKSAENFMLSHGFNPMQTDLVKRMMLSNKDRAHCQHYNPTINNFRR